MATLDRDRLGKVVRDAWIAWARTQPNPKSSWLVPYDELSEPDKEADRQIAEAVLQDLNARRIALIEQKNRDGLTAEESAEFDALQGGVFAAIDLLHPLPPTGELERKLDAIKRRLD